MISIALILAILLLYFGLLFAVAYYADKRREGGRSITSNPYVYSLSLSVFITSLTFYGTVGQVATIGIDFLAPLLGGTLIASSWWFLLRRMVRVSKEQNIVTIADFLSSRYGNSRLLGTLVTVFAILVVMPYIAVQLRTIAKSFDILASYVTASGSSGQVPFSLPVMDLALVSVLVLGFFGILFGARRLDSSEQHEGLVAAVALEALVKIVAFLAVGLFVTYGLFNGATDIFQRFLAEFPEKTDLLLLGTQVNPYAKWFSLILVGMVGVMAFPRQFQVAVIENSDENHIKTAMWFFPAYLFLSQLFVIPIALGGLIYFHGNSTGAAYFALTLPLTSGHPWLALLVFLGGFSAAAGMVIVSSVALSPMILNYLIMPLILHLRIFNAINVSGLLLTIKRLGIFLVIFIGYLYYRFIGESYALLTIGFVSFVAVAQFAPALIGGLYWRRANLRGAAGGLILGFILWVYTLLIPIFVRSGWLKAAILKEGLFGLGCLRPLELFGLGGLDILSHSLFWTLFFNVGGFVLLSLFTRPGEIEEEQALKFVNVFSPSPQIAEHKRLSKAPAIMEFVDLMSKFIGEKPARTAIAEFLGDAEIDRNGSVPDHQVPALKRFTERTLAASVGSAPARIILENYLAARGSEMEDVFDIFGSVSIARKASREQLGVLYETARLVASGDDLQAVLDNILELLQQQFRLDLCIIRILDKEKNALTVHSQKGMSSEHFETSDRELTLDSYIGEAFLTNSVIVINDSDVMDKPVSARIVRREGITAFAHAPITIDGTPIGVLTAFSKSSKGIFSAEFIELFKSLAGQIGIAWRNARQVERLMIAREKERELDIARTIQLGLLPGSTPVIKGVSLAGICIPAHEVGGDYYDYLLREKDALDLVIADVSGHSVGAALTMGWIRTFIRDRARAQNIHRAKEIMGALNEFFYEDLTRAELFVTMFYLIYDSPTRTLSFANAGHNRPLLYRAGSRGCERLDAEGLILGIISTVVFEEKQKLLEPGDILLLYTDGILEVENQEGVFFGEERLQAILEQKWAASPQTIIDALLGQARAFSGLKTFIDDVTVVVMKIE